MTDARKKTAGSRPTEPVADVGNDHLIALLDALPIPASVASAADRLIVHANAAWLRLLGFANADEVIGRPVESLIAPASLEKAKHALSRGQATGEFSQSDRRYQLIRADGALVDVEIAGAPATLHGSPAIVSVLTDLSEVERTRRSLEASGQSYRTLMENAADAMIVYRDERILYANPAGLKLYGAKRAEDVVGRLIWDFIAPESRGMATERVKALMSDEMTLPSTRVNLIDVEGHPFAAEASDVHIPYGAGTAVLTTLRDLRPSEAAEVALAESQGFLGKILDTTTNLIYIYDLVETRNVYSNRELTDFLGYTPQQVLDLGSELFAHIMHPDDMQAVATHHARCAKAAEGETLEIEYRMQHADGRWRWLYSRDVPFSRDEAGTVTQILGVCSDVTERKQTEDALRESEERFRSVVSVLREGIILQDADGRLLTFNDAAADIFHIGAKDVLGETSISRDWGTIREDGTDLPSAEHPSMVTFESGQPCNEVLVGVKGPAGVRWIEVNTEPMTRPGEARPYAVVVSCTDVTERRQAVQELEEYKAGLEALVAQRTAEFEEASRAKSQFLASMSHELRTPLNSIIGFTGIMLQGLTGEFTPEQRTQLEMVNRAGRQLLGLVSDVLDLERIEAGRVELDVEDLDIAKTLNGLADTVRPLAADAGLGLGVRVDGALFHIRTDRRRLEQILLNFLSNAVKYTDEGSLELSASSRADGRVAFSVRDTGIGIAEEDQAAIFDEFRQLPAHRGAKYPGAGLGLAISRQLADLLGGRIELSSTLGKGSTFTLILPAG
jgi:PAS domain S-box-containing protein